MIALCIIMENIFNNERKIKSFEIFLLTLSVQMSRQRNLLVDTIADFAFVLAIILESNVLDLQIRADYLIVLSANTEMRIKII